MNAHSWAQANIILFFTFASLTIILENSQILCVEFTIDIKEVCGLDQRSRKQLRVFVWITIIMKAQLTGTYYFEHDLLYLPLRSFHVGPRAVTGPASSFLWISILFFKAYSFDLRFSITFLMFPLISFVHSSTIRVFMQTINYSNTLNYTKLEWKHG